LFVSILNIFPNLWVELKKVVFNFFFFSVLLLGAYMLQSEKGSHQSLSEFILQGLVPIYSVKPYMLLVKSGILSLQNFLIYFMDKNVISYPPLTLLSLNILMELTWTPLLIWVGIDKYNSQMYKVTKITHLRHNLITNL
jgi:hypothetical protein